MAYTPSSADDYNLLKEFSGHTSNQIIKQDTTLKWQIINIDKESKIIDIVCENVPQYDMYLSGASAYNNGVNLLNDICEKLYSNKEKNIIARSINLIDLEKHLTEVGFEKRNAYTFGDKDIIYGSTLTYTTYKKYPVLYANEVSAGVNVTSVIQPKIEKTIDPYRSSVKGYDSQTTLTFSEAGTKGITMTQTLYEMAVTSENYGEAADVITSPTTYWMASRFTYPSNNGKGYYGLCCCNPTFGGNSMFTTDGYEYQGVSKHPVCPLISIDTNLFTGSKDASQECKLK